VEQPAERGVEKTTSDGPKNSGRISPTFDDTAVDRLEHPYLHAADEVRAALAWSRRAADAETDFAERGWMTPALRSCRPTG
jgi:hypothetical protein